MPSRMFLSPLNGMTSPRNFVTNTNSTQSRNKMTPKLASRGGNHSLELSVIFSIPRRYRASRCHSSMSLRHARNPMKSNSLTSTKPWTNLSHPLAPMSHLTFFRWHRQRNASNTTSAQNSRKVILSSSKSTQDLSNTTLPLSPSHVPLSKRDTTTTTSRWPTTARLRAPAKSSKTSSRRRASPFRLRSRRPPR